MLSAPSRSELFRKLWVLGRSPQEEKDLVCDVRVRKIFTKVKLNKLCLSANSQSRCDILLNLDPGFDLDLDSSRAIYLDYAFCVYPLSSAAVALLALERRVLAVSS